MTISYSDGALMTRAELEDILARHSGLSADVFAGADDTPLADLGMESLAAMEIQAVIKDRLSVHIPEEDIPGMGFNALLAGIHAAQAERAESGGE
jgi:acyl carrier protein